MSQSLQFLRSTTPGQKPVQLFPGQIAFNLVDKLLFIGTGGNDIVDESGNVSAGIVGKGFFTSNLDFSVSVSAAAAYTDSKIAELVGGAPGLLDTLNELAAAINDDANFATTVTASLASVSSDLNAEVSRAQAAEATLNNSISAEANRALAAEAANAAAISSEESRALAAEAANAAAIVAEETRALAAEAANAAAISAEETRALAAEAANAAAVSAEETRALAAEAQIVSDLVAAFDQGTF